MPANGKLAAQPAFANLTGPLAYALSKETLAALKEANDLRSPPSPGTLGFEQRQITQDQSLEAKLYAALADAKVLTSQVAMHLDREWRNKLFRQLDSLHDMEEWDKETNPLQRASFATFLRTLHSIGMQRRPGLGLSYAGNLIGAWTIGANRLTLEFMPNDQVRWILTRDRDGALDRAAGETNVARLSNVLSPYDPGVWFNNASTANT